MNKINETAKTIIQQLGGLTLLRLLLGTRKVLFNDKGIDFDIQGCAKINRVHIEYDAGMDLYKMKFFRVPASKAPLNLVAQYEEVYADQLCDMIESETGLFLGPLRIQMVQRYA
jgi:uncharacterized protein YwlG (UPF0340 family)